MNYVYRVRLWKYCKILKTSPPSISSSKRAYENISRGAYFQNFVIFEKGDRNHFKSESLGGALCNSQVLCHPWLAARIFYLLHLGLVIKWVEIWKGIMILKTKIIKLSYYFNRKLQIWKWQKKNNVL